MKLTKKQQVFIEEYLTCWNATEAARRAGFAFPNKNGPQLLVNAGIREMINDRMKEKTMGANEVLQRLDQQARVNISTFISPDGSLNMDAVKEYGYLIKKFSWNKFGPVIELHDAQTALALIGKHYGLFVDRIEQIDQVSQTSVNIYIPDNGRDNESA